MEISQAILSILNSRDTIRDKLVELGVELGGTKLENLATAIESISKQSGLSVLLQAGDAYTIPEGYHDGTSVISAAGGFVSSVALENYAYEQTKDNAAHSRTYTGTAGNMLLLLLLHRGELVTPPTGWTKLGMLKNTGDANAGNTTITQFVTIFSKVCDGAENIQYEQTLSSTSITCIIEFCGVSGFEILESTRMENVKTSVTPEFTCSKTTNRMTIWVATSVYFNGDTYKWSVSNGNIWAISDNHDIQPRLGVFVDNRTAPTDFTIDSGMSDRYVSALCIQVNS